MNQNLFNIKKWKRYSTQPDIHKPWDDKMGNSNISFFPVTHSHNPQTSFNLLNDDYNVLIASHSRLDNTLAFLDFVLFFVHHFHPKMGYDNFQNWMFATRDYIINNEQMSLPQKQAADCQLLRVAEAIMTFYKLDMIAHIKTKRAINIYGDQGWQSLFPKYYQKQYLSPQELASRIAQKADLLLLPNHVTFYLESQPALDRALTAGTPYICYPAFVTTQDFFGLRALEYKNHACLNQLIDDINPTLKNAALEHGLHQYSSAMQAGMRELVEHITAAHSAQTDVFSHLIKNHQVLFKQKIQTYQKTNLTFIQNSVEILTQKMKVAFDVKQSHLFEQAFVRELIKMKNSPPTS